MHSSILLLTLILLFLLFLLFPFPSISTPLPLSTPLTILILCSYSTQTMFRHWRSTGGLSLHLLFILSLHYAIFIVHAQTSWLPTPSYQANSVFIEGKAFYIQAGLSNTQSKAVQQIFSIDLSKPFNTSSPPYTQMSGGPNVGRIPNTLARNGSDWFFRVSNVAAYIYTLDTGFPSNKMLYSPEDFFSNFSAAATAPGTGDIIIPSMDNTHILRFINGEYVYLNTKQPTKLSAKLLFSIAASNSAQAVFVFGGFDMLTNSSSSTLFRYEPVTSTWSQVELMKGDIPLPRQGACMVPAHNGTKLVLFGGYTATSLSNVLTPIGTSLSDVYVLEVATLTWSKGADGGLERARSNHVCAVSGDSLVVWGGISKAMKTPPVDIVLVYDFSSKTWQDSFTASGSSDTGGPTPKTGSDNSGSSSGSPASTIAGGVTAVVVCLAAILILVYRKRWARKKEDPSQIILLGNLQTKEEWKRPSPHEAACNTHLPISVSASDTKLDDIHGTLRSPEGNLRHPQGDEVQAQEQLIIEYRLRREIQLEQQRELDLQIERHLAEVQSMKDQQGIASRSHVSDRRGPQYWSTGSQEDKSGSFFGPLATGNHESEPRSPQKYHSGSISCGST